MVVRVDYIHGQGAKTEKQESGNWLYESLGLLVVLAILHFAHEDTVLG